MELIIKLEHFNAKFLQIQNANNKRPNFYNVIYNSPTVILNNLIFETPWMDVPFGICQYNNNDEKQKNKYYIDLSFNNSSSQDELNNFYNCMNDIDDFIIDFLYHNRHDLGLIGNVENYYSKQIRFNKNNNNYPPTLKLKIFKGITKILDPDNNLVDFSTHVRAGSRSKAFIKCNGLWVFNNKFGMSWKVMKLINQPLQLPKKLTSIQPTESDIIESDSDDLVTDDTDTMFVYDDYNREFVDLCRKLTTNELMRIDRLEYEIEELERNRNFEIKHQYMEDIEHKNLLDEHITDPDEVTYRIEHCSHKKNHLHLQNNNINASIDTFITGDNSHTI
jgi:hypothetical protein